MASLSWDGMSESYDVSRRNDNHCLAAALDELAGRFPPAQYPSLFEPGIGTGRIAIPLARRGYQVTGVDISGEMLAKLEAKLGEPGLKERVAFRQADVKEVPYGDGSFDLAVAVHLFWFVDCWKRAVAELRRIVKPSGPIVIMNTGSGAESPRLNERYKALCAERGDSIRNPGAGSNQEVGEYLGTMGYTLETLRGKWKWLADIRGMDALSHVAARAYSFTQLSSERVHREVVEVLRKEVPTWPEVESVPNEIWMIIAIPAGGGSPA